MMMLVSRPLRQEGGSQVCAIQDFDRSPSCPAFAGWLKTVDQYYMGANNSIQHAGVQVHQLHR